MSKKTKLAAALTVLVLVVGSVAVIYGMHRPSDREIPKDMSHFLDSEIGRLYGAKEGSDVFTASAHRLMRSRKDGERTVAYIWFQCTQYRKGNPLEEVHTVSAPAAVTIEPTGDDKGYRIIDFRTPGSDAMFAVDVRKIFPPSLQGEALYAPKYADELNAACRAQAEAHFH